MQAHEGVEDQQPGTERLDGLVQPLAVGLEVETQRGLGDDVDVEGIEVDAGGRAVRTLSRSAPVSGNNLVLNLDAKLQEIVYAAFGEYKPEGMGGSMWIVRFGYDAAIRILTVGGGGQDRQLTEN